MLEPVFCNDCRYLAPISQTVVTTAGKVIRICDAGPVRLQQTPFSLERVYIDPTHRNANNDCQYYEKRMPPVPRAVPREKASLWKRAWRRLISWLNHDANEMGM